MDPRQLINYNYEVGMALNIYIILAPLYGYLYYTMGQDNYLYWELTG